MLEEGKSSLLCLTTTLMTCGRAPVIIPRFNGSMVAIQSVDDHRGNHESRRRLRGIINHPGMTLKRTRDRLGRRTQRAPPPPLPNAFVRPSHGCGDTQR